MASLCTARKPEVPCRYCAPYRIERRRGSSLPMPWRMFAISECFCYCCNFCCSFVFLCVVIFRYGCTSAQEVERECGYMPSLSVWMCPVLSFSHPHSLQGWLHREPNVNPFSSIVSINCRSYLPPPTSVPRLPSKL